ncbi:MAG: GNAT family N-acetyltransferase [Ignavibacteriae bacterium]|nr:GNAT family N-acetyltransferase [Ignavibacteriota bacterium]
MTVERMDFSDARLRTWWTAAYAGGLHTNTPFQSLEWNESWWKTFGAADERRELFLLAGLDADCTIRFIAPLFLQKRAFGGALAWEHLLFIGDDLAPYLDIVVPAADNADYTEDIVRYCEQQRPRAWLQLRDIPVGGIASRIAIHFERRDERLVLPGRPCLRMELAPCGETPLEDLLMAAVRPTFRRTLKKALTRYADAANGLAWTYGAADDTLRACLTVLSAERFGETAFLAESCNADFFRELQDRLAHEAKYAVLTAHGVPVHCLMGFEHGGIFYYFLSGMLPSASALAPGIINFSLLINTLRTRGLRALDFLRGEERYKRDFGGVESRTVCMRVVPPRARARHAAAGFLRGMRRMIVAARRQERAA